MEDRLYKKLEAYGKSDFYPFHMPGHKRNPLAVEGDFPVERDITEIDGFDNLHHAEDILKRAQEDVARLYGVPESFYSINGSSGAILAAVSAAVDKGGQILVARNCHKAVYHAIYLRELSATYIYPHEDPKLGINGGISPGRVEMYLAENPEIQAVLITSPTYDGIVSDVARIAEIAHHYGVPLIVDEAHGAHFRFSDYFPVSAAQLGADVVINSVHKTLPCLTQTGVIHLCSERISREKLKRFLRIYQSSSPSYILMPSIDECIRLVDEEREKVFKPYVEMLCQLRKEIGKLKNLQLLETMQYDASKIVISASGMCEAGRIRHHLKHNLWRKESTILFVGYQAKGTLGRIILEGAKSVNLFGEEIEIQAEIRRLAGISGHADNNGLLKWIGSFEKKPEKVFVIHGEDSVCQVFTDRLRNEMHLDAGAPYSGTVFNLATGAYEKECEPVHVVKTEKSLNKAMKANTPFARLLAAGQRLLTVIRHNEGGANKDLARFTSQINSLCDKWDR
mgnify:CR=1 FL=1